MIIFRIKVFFIQWFRKIKKAWNKYILRKPETLWDNVVFPFVHRIAAKTIAWDLQSVQPMNVPNIKLMYLDYVYQPPPGTQLVLNFPPDLEEIRSTLSGPQVMASEDSQLDHQEAIISSLKRTIKYQKERIAQLEMERMKYQNKADSAYLKSNV